MAFEQHFGLSSQNYDQNMSNGSCDAGATADRCREEISRAESRIRPTPISSSNAKELNFDDPNGIRVADVPIPGTDDNRLLVPVPHAPISANPYIEGQTPPYHPTEPVHAVAWGRPGETVPNRIEKPNEFAKQILEATKAAAARIHTVNDCARGVREGLNDLNMGFQISSDMTFEPDKYRWRSATQLGEYLSKSGLFDAVPFEKIKTKLEDGFIVVRHWNDGLIKSRGEDRGDIAVVSKNGYQYNDHSEPYQPNESRYNGGYVLVPKGYEYKNEPIQLVDLSEKRRGHSRGHGHGHGHSQGHHRRRRG